MYANRLGNEGREGTKGNLDVHPHKFSRVGAYVSPLDMSGFSSFQ